MRKIEITVYTFSELSDEAKALIDYAEVNGCEFTATGDIV